MKVYFMLAQNKSKTSENNMSSSSNNNRKTMKQSDMTDTYCISSHFFFGVRYFKLQVWTFSRFDYGRISYHRLLYALGQLAQTPGIARRKRIRRWKDRSSKKGRKKNSANSTVIIMLQIFYVAFRSIHTHSKNTHKFSQCVIIFHRRGHIISDKRISALATLHLNGMTKHNVL